MTSAPNAESRLLALSFEPESARALDNSVRRQTCPVCSSRHIRSCGAIAYRRPVKFSTHDVRLTSPGELWRCLGCRSAFAENIVSQADAEVLYRTGSSIDKWAPAAFAGSKPAEMIEFLEVRMKGRRTALDIGCNSGELMRFLRERGMTMTGVEPSGASRERCIADGFEVKKSLADVADSYDVAFAFDVIEHLHDVPGFLESCRRVIRPGGELILLTGNPTSFVARMLGARWWYVRAPEHITFPSVKGLGAAPGFRVAAAIPTVASKGYRRAWPSRISGLFRMFLDPRSDGLPLPFADHALIALARL